jgi:hypothetical protein
LLAHAVKAASAVVKPEGREGERPREAKPRRARAPLKPRNRKAVTPTGRGIKPLKRSR